MPGIFAVLSIYGKEVRKIFDLGIRAVNIYVKVDEI
jgi:hypothetical protein